MKFPIFFAYFLLFLVWFTYKRLRSEQQEKAREDKYWNKEELSNSIRRKDISLLPYVYIPLDKLPLGINNPKLLPYEEKIRHLSEFKILNLTGMTNTELKLAYGAGNLPFLSECDQNFTELARLMQDWGLCLYELGLKKEAECVLTYAIQWGSDIKNSYLLLAKIFREQNNEDGLLHLKESAEKLTSLRKENILAALAEI